MILCIKYAYIIVYKGIYNDKEAQINIMTNRSKQISFNNMINYNPCNFIYYPFNDVPRIHEIITFIKNSDINTLYKI